MCVFSERHADCKVRQSLSLLVEQRYIKAAFGATPVVLLLSSILNQQFARDKSL